MNMRLHRPFLTAWLLCMVLCGCCTGLVKAQTTQGFFLEESEKEAFIPVKTKPYEKPASTGVTVTLDADILIAEAGRYVYGQNANVYMTQMVDQPKLLTHLQELSPNIIRYPGGNLSSIFFWNSEPGHPPTDAPQKILDASGNEIDPGYWYGRNSEGWTLSVDNYYEMLSLTASTGMITINYGYARYGTATDPVAAAAHHAAEWVRYDNGRTKFWEIGNESNGSWQAGFRIDKSKNQDGQPEIVTGELYGSHFKVFADSMRKAASEKGSEIYIGAQLLAEPPASWWNDTDRWWNEGVFAQAGDVPDFYIIHSYYTPYATNSGASEILESASTVTTAMMDYVTEQQVAAGVSVKPIALTEWNIFAEGSKQASSYINGLHAVLVSAELIKNKYGMAARWNLANGWNNGNDHGLFNQGDEPGGAPRWNPRAAFYYLTLFQKNFGNSMIGSNVSGNQSVVAYGSRFSSGELSAVIVNKGTKEESIKLETRNFDPGDRYYLYVLTGGTDNGEFSLKVAVNGTFGPYSSGGPDLDEVSAYVASTVPDITFRSPARSATFVVVEKGDGVVATEEDISSQVEIYPNPTQADAVVKLSLTGPTTVEVSDGCGRVVYQTTFDRETKLPGNFLSSGVMIIKLTNAGEVWYKKLIVK